MSRNSTPSTIATIGIDIGKNTFHRVGLDKCGAIILQLRCGYIRDSPTASGEPRRLLSSTPF